VTYFRNDVKDFVFRSPLSEADLVRRLPELSIRFPGRPLVLDAAAEFPIVENIGADTVLQGIESHADFGFTSELFAEAGVDYTRGTVKATGDPLPRMPPLRTQFGLRFQRNAFQAGRHVTAAAAQERLFEGETRTDGYVLLRLYTAYSVEAGGLLHTITARVDNATNELYRNHLSLIKDLALEMGRNFRALYSIKF
jgi:iron complex outermembrane receptor protein